MPRANSRRLTLTEKTEARLLAESLLCERVSEREIIVALMNEFAGISKTVARKFVKTAVADIVAQVQESAPHRRAQQLASLDRLYSEAVSAKKYGAAVSIQRLIATLEGNAKPKPPKGYEKPAPQELAVGAADEFEDRSEADCDYYAEHGYFPEEAPGATDDSEEAEAGAEPVFPLH